MRKIFEADLDRGFLDIYEAEDTLFVFSAFRRGVTGVQSELSKEEAADLAEALLRVLGPETAQSIYSSTLIATKVTETEPTT